jgi:hypothetical protein
VNGHGGQDANNGSGSGQAGQNGNGGSGAANDASGGEGKNKDGLNQAKRGEGKLSDGVRWVTERIGVIQGQYKVRNSHSNTESRPNAFFRRLFLLRHW